MKVVAIIPARGGSKSLPRKNIRVVGGRPLIAYSIATALGCARIDRTLVSTDDPEIAAIAREHGADVPFLRPAEFARDDSTDLEVLSHALKWMVANEQEAPELVVYLRPTEPLRRVATVEAAIARLIEYPEADSLRSIRLAQQTPYKMWRMPSDWLEPAAMLEGVAEPYNQPRQKLPAVYWQDGYVDVIRARTILEQGSSTGKKILGFLISEPAINIDYEDELAAADLLLRGHAGVLHADGNEASGVKRVLVCGLGSIGQRHVRNLRALYGTQLHLGAFRERSLSAVIRDDLQGLESEPVEKRYSIEVFTDLRRALASPWDAVFITNPIHRHLAVALEAARAGFPLFIEKPLGEQLTPARELAQICAKNQLTVMVAFQLRFHPLLVQLKQRLETSEFGRVLRASFHFGEYLPGMHPYEDYRQGHMARHDQGGGVVHCLSHELDLANWLVGVPRTVSAQGGKLTDLEHDVEDFVDLTATALDTKERQILLHVHLNFWQQPPERQFSLITENANVTFDYFAAALRIRHRDRPEETVRLDPFVRNELFLSELRHFAECLTSKATPSPCLADGLRALQFADAAHQALQEHREVTLS